MSEPTVDRTLDKMFSMLHRARPILMVASENDEELAHILALSDALSLAVVRSINKRTAKQIDTKPYVYPISKWEFFNKVGTNDERMG